MSAPPYLTSMDDVMLQPGNIQLIRADVIGADFWLTHSIPENILVGHFAGF